MNVIDTGEVLISTNEHVQGQPNVVLMPGHSRNSGAQRSSDRFGWDIMNSPGWTDEGSIEEHTYYTELCLWSLDNLDWSGINLWTTDRYGWGKMPFLRECAKVDELAGRKALSLMLHLNSVDGVPSANGTMTAYTRYSADGRKFAKILQENVKAALGTQTYADGLVGNPSSDFPRVDLTRVTGGPCCLLEAGFLTNDEDFYKLQKNRFELIRSVHQSVFEFFA